MGVSMDAGTKERLTKHQPAQEGRFSEPVGAAPQGVDADGGYAVPADIVTKIISLCQARESLMDLVTVIQVKTYDKDTIPSTRGETPMILGSPSGCPTPPWWAS